MIDAAEPRKLLLDAGIPPEAIRIESEEYALPSPDWITDDLGGALADIYFKASVSPGNPRAKCTLRSLIAAAWASLCWMSSGKGEATVAIGRFNFLSQLHSLTIAVHRREDGSKYLAWYEPSPGVREGAAAFSPSYMLPKTLTPEDIKSCTSCHFF